MSTKVGAVHVDTSLRTYVAADGTTRHYRRHLLRRSYRDARGKPAKETLANLSALPDDAVEALRKALRGTTMVEADALFEIERALPHGDVAAAHTMATKLGLKKLLGPACPERDLAYALIISRAVSPKSKLSTTRWWDDTTLGPDLGIGDATTDDAYAAMDWLLTRQDKIEATLAKQHLAPGGLAMFDLSSSWVEGRHCPLAEFGHSRDKKKGKKQIEYGLLTDPDGRPVAIHVFPGNTSDSEAFGEAVKTVREKFRIGSLTMVGDRGSITSARIKDLRALEGMEWITALRAPSIAKLAADGGPLQMTLFDEQNIAEITHESYPGERLICCRNPALAEERARKRESLLRATETELEKIAASVAAGRLAGADKIGVKIGKIVDKRKVGKHFVLEVTDTSFAYHRDTGKINAEAALDGLYVLRTRLRAEALDTTGVVTAYKNLSEVERDFRIIKVDDLELRPIHHYLENRVRAHVLLCMLAAYLTWHLRRALAPLIFTDEDVPPRTDPVLPARRSLAAKVKDATKETPEELPVRRYSELLAHLRTLTRNTVVIDGRRIEKISVPTPSQRRVFELIGAPIPVSLL
jgi:transposase